MENSTKESIHFPNEDSEKQNVSSNKKNIKRMSSSSSSSTNETENGLNVSSNGDDLVDFDDLIHHFGECGRYQFLLFFLMIPFICFIAFVFYAQFFITLVPEHYWCSVPELQSLSVHERYENLIYFVIMNKDKLFFVYKSYLF